MTGNDNDRRQLQKVEAMIAHLTEFLKQSEAARDAILVRLLDTEGAHDRHPVAVR